MAMVKHFIAYDGGNNVVVDSATLHEIYLQPFADAIDAGVASIMCSYDTLRVVAATPSAGGTPGPYSCGNSDTQNGILRGELGFKGFVTSDWGANHDTSFINDGLDMEMPGTGFGGVLPTYFSASALKAAIAAGTVSMSTIDAAVGRILFEMDRFGLLSGHSKHQGTPVPVGADERVVQQTAQDAATLLKNDSGALPLSSADLGHLALIGPGAGQTIAVGQAGENAAGIVSRQTGTYQVLSQLLRRDHAAHLNYAVGDDMTGTPVPASALTHGGQPGLLRTNTGDSTSSVVPQLDNTLANGKALPAGSAWTWTGDLTVPAAGSYWINLGLLGAGGSISLDGKQIAATGFINGTAPRYGVLRPGDNSVLPTTDGLDNLRTQLNLSAGQHTLTVAIKADVSGDPVQARLNWVTPAQQQANTDAAVNAARHAKAAVVFAWSTGALDTPLPDGQDQLIAAVAAANPDTIVVLNNSDPVAMPWLGSVKAVLDMWYPGDTGGYATANVLLGAADPAGRLPFTWPASLGQGVANQPATHPERTSNGVDANGTFCTTPGSPFGGPQCTDDLHRGHLRRVPLVRPAARDTVVSLRVRPVLHPFRLLRPALGTRPGRRPRRGVPGDQHRQRRRRRGPAGLPGRAGQRPGGRSLRGPGPGGLRSHHPPPGPVPGRVAARAAAPAPVLGHPGRALGDGGGAAAALRRRQRAGHRARRHRHHPRRGALTHRKPR